MRFENYINVEGSIECLTGLKIGGTKDTVGIGETDNPIIRHPITRLPYIPGSSLKGKTRSLLEIKYSPDSQSTGKPCTCSTCFICRLYGCGNPVRSSEPTRLIFRDARLGDESRRQLEESLPGSFVEIKPETQIDRKTGTASNHNFREQERVPEGTAFDFDFTIRLFEEDREHFAEFKERLAEAFDMLENDYLGGNGTRGYGRVRVSGPNGEPMGKYLRGLALP